MESDQELTERARLWASTMAGFGESGSGSTAHGHTPRSARREFGSSLGTSAPPHRSEREALEGQEWTQ